MDEDNHVRQFLRNHNNQWNSSADITKGFSLTALTRHLLTPPHSCTWSDLRVQSEFIAAARFMDGEAFIDYEWMINMIDTILPQAPNILVVDCDFGLIKAITEKWSRAFFIICRFHIANNIITRCRRYFLDAGEEFWKSFMDHWNSIVHAPTEDMFMQLWQHLPTIAVSSLTRDVIICLTQSFNIILICI